MGMPCHVQELREQGDWLILFATQVELLRFVHGGKKVTDNRAFKHRLGTFVATTSSFEVKEVGGKGTVERIQSDWGWEMKCSLGYVRVASYDRGRGFSATESSFRSKCGGDALLPSPAASACTGAARCGVSVSSPSPPLDNNAAGSTSVCSSPSSCASSCASVCPIVAAATSASSSSSASGSCASAAAQECHRACLQQTGPSVWPPMPVNSDFSGLPLNALYPI